MPSVEVTTTVADLKAALEAKWEAERLASDAELQLDSLLTDDTVAALIAVAEAAQELVGWRRLERYSMDPDWSADVARVRRHLAPLVLEVGREVI